MRRFALYSFVISLLWLGFVCSSYVVVFVAAPQALAGDVEKALSVTRLLCLKSLNRAEWVSCAFCWLFILRIRIVRERNAIAVLILASALLIIKSWFALVSLEQLLADNPSTTWSANTFLVLQGAQAVALGVLSAMSIQAFARAVISE